MPEVEIATFANRRLLTLLTLLIAADAGVLQSEDGPCNFGLFPIPFRLLKGLVDRL